MKLIKGTQCGASEFTYKNGFMICSYCGTKYVAGQEDIEPEAPEALPDTSNTEICEENEPDTSLIHEDIPYPEENEFKALIKNLRHLKTHETSEYILLVAVIAQ